MSYRVIVSMDFDEGRVHFECLALLWQQVEQEVFRWAEDDDRISAPMSPNRPFCLEFDTQRRWTAKHLVASLGHAFLGTVNGNEVLAPLRVRLVRGAAVVVYEPRGGTGPRNRSRLAQVGVEDDSADDDLRDALVSVKARGNVSPKHLSSLLRGLADDLDASPEKDR